MYENGYLAAHVDMLRHQHKYTCQVLNTSVTPMSLIAATHCPMQVSATNQSPLKKRSASSCVTPIKPGLSESFPGFSAKRQAVSEKAIYPDFTALCTKRLETETDNSFLKTAPRLHTRNGKCSERIATRLSEAGNITISSETKMGTDWHLIRARQRDDTEGNGKGLHVSKVFPNIAQHTTLGCMCI